MDLNSATPPIMPALELPASPSDLLILPSKALVFSTGSIIFSRLTLVRQLGQGRCSTVWLAEDHRFRRVVALKIFRAVAVEFSTEERRIWNEILRRLRILNHPHINMPLEFFSTQGWSAINSLPVEGPTLAEALRSRPSQVFPFNLIQAQLVQVGMALMGAHSGARIIHGNLNAFNVLINESGQAKITDFGFYPSTGSVEFTQADQDLKLGTLSPQRINGEKPSFSDDIYAFGALAFQMLTGQNPSTIEPDAASANAASLQAVTKLPEKWQQQLLATLSHDPASRPATMQTILQEIAPVELLHNAEKIAVKASVNPIRPRHRHSQRGSRRAKSHTQWWQIILVITCLLALPAALAFLITGSVKNTKQLQIQQAQEDLLEKAQAALEKAKLKEIEDQLALTALQRKKMMDLSEPEHPSPTPKVEIPLNSEAVGFYKDGQAKQKNGDFQGAFQSYEMAVVLEPAWADLLENRARVLVALNRADEAVDECNKVLQHSPTRVSTLLERGQVYLKMNQTDSAKADFNQVLKIQPDSTEAKKALDSLSAAAIPIIPANTKN